MENLLLAEETKSVAVGALKIIAIDLVLAGDNAVVIGMAARTLSPSQRRGAIIIGAAMAVIIRVIATLFVSRLLSVPFLSLVGGILVAGIAVKLLIEDEQVADHHEIQGFWHAVKVIAVADIVMSLDNVLAVGGASGGHDGLIIFGLLLSIPLVMFCSQGISVLLDKYPRLAEVGAAILGWTGGEMVAHDLIYHESTKRGIIHIEQTGFVHTILAHIPHAAMLVVVLVLAHLILARKRRHTPTPHAE